MNTCPHCLGAGCIHCRNDRAKVARRRARSKLTAVERRELGLIPLYGLFGQPTPPPPKPQKFGVRVLPADFAL